MLDRVKLAMRITTDVYDEELSSLIDAALLDLGIAGVTKNTIEVADEVVRRAVITYCRLHFGSPDDYANLKASYDEQKAQLQTATGYTDWGDADVSG